MTLSISVSLTVSALIKAAAAKIGKKAQKWFV
jgi:hypothetical protein